MSDTLENFAEYHISNITLLIPEDGMRAVIEVDGPFKDTDGFSLITGLLNEGKVAFGVDVSSIHKLVDLCKNEPGIRIHEAVVARGTPPIEGKNGSFEILVKAPPPVSIDEEGRADFRNIQHFQTVDKGQVVGRLFLPEPGKSGYNVFGKEVEPKPIHAAPLDFGKNIQKTADSNDLVAQTHGIFLQKEDRIDINPVLEVAKDVGLETGNVNYDGNVRIGGNITKGSSVSAMGDLLVGGMVESGNLIVGGSLTVRKGINTRREGTVKVTGNIQSVYIDNTALEAEGSLLIEKSLIASRVICYSDISVSAKGSTISGGDISVFGSISADFVGNRAENVTKITLGVHHKNCQYYELQLKELEKVEREFEKLGENVAKIKEYAQRMRGKIPVDKQAQFRVVFEKYKEVRDLHTRLTIDVEDIKSRRYNKNEVKIVVRDTIFPGVDIMYRGTLEKILAPMTACVLRFRPDQDKPTIEAYRPLARKSGIQ